MVLVVIYSSGGASAGGVGREEPGAYRAAERRALEALKLRRRPSASAETFARAGVLRDGQTDETRARRGVRSDRASGRGRVSPRAWHQS